MMVWYDIVLRLFIAIIVGACIGMERQWRHRMAGLRTNALVSLGACIFVLLSVMIDHDASPSRIASQVVSGIGFLGGGVIIRDGFSIRGLILRLPYGAQLLLVLLQALVSSLQLY